MVKNNPTIGLYGILGVYNYGTEAIIKGTEIILREIWPDVHIKYASLRPEDDKKRLKGCNIEIIPRKIKRISSISRLNGILGEYTGFYSKKLFQENLEWLEDRDLVFSIGGDFYTTPSNCKDAKIRSYYNLLIHFGEVVKSKGKKLVIWGASIGPFEGCPKTKEIFLKHLSKVDLITSREFRTTQYLKNQKIINNVLQCPNQHFQFRTLKI